MTEVPVVLSNPRVRRASITVAPSDPDRVPAAVHVLAKPTGPICNLDCSYCYFLSKEALYPGDRFRMADRVLEIYLRQLIEAHAGQPEVVVAWQGGEPTLMGVEFFRRALRLTESYHRPGQVVQHTLQTNATLITEEWAAAFAEHDVLVGVSLDGPPAIHDRYRRDKRGGPTSERVLRGLAHLQEHGVRTNVLCTVHAANQDRPLEVYRYFRDDLGIHFIQFIPIVERLEDPDPGRRAVTERTVDPLLWGRFLGAVFDEWLRRDVGSVFVSHFDAALASWVGVQPSLCIFAETCGNAVALEHNGDVYSCDHFVDPDHLLGNIADSHIADMVSSAGQVAFGNAKRDSLPRYCRECPVLFACNGECPKNRFTIAPTGEDGLNYLCGGYREFFSHIDGPMRLMAGLLRSGRSADEVMGLLARSGRNQPCPCGSGRKAKVCHQNPLPTRDSTPG